jgi:outer membrane protein OmpA-like peptidoglycan-associated protein
VAVDTRVRNKRRKLTTVPVPVARPDGVSARAAPRRAHVGAAAAISVGPDMDGDGICDADDRCPSSPEVYNGLSDSDGCPDAGRVVVHKARLEVLDKIYFRSFSSKIQPVSHPILDAIAATLKGNPQIRLVEIQGHADRREPRRLARLRALAVLRYLIRRGVAASRLKARGYGRRRPVDRRHNPVAWSKNRRVEFTILKRGS